MVTEAFLCLKAPSLVSEEGGGLAGLRGALTGALVVLAGLDFGGVPAAA